MTGKSVSPQHRVDDALDLYCKGLSAPDIASRVGVSTGTIYNWLKHAGIARRSVGFSNRTPQAIEAEILRLFNDGCTGKDISSACGVSIDTVRRLLSKNDVSLALRESPERLCSVEGCGNVHAARGVCNKHWKRHRHHNTTDYYQKPPTSPDQIASRFWAKVERTDSCWLWHKAGRNYQGYGGFKVDGRMYRAHRWSWEYAFGPIPPTMCVLHHCDNPPCVRPEHLFLGTIKDNVQDMLSKNRQNPAFGDRNGQRTHPEKRNAGENSWQRKFPERIVRGPNHPQWGKSQNRGSENGNAKLNEDRVLDILRLFKQGIEIHVLAKRFNVSLRCIEQVVSGRAWTHVQRT